MSNKEETVPATLPDIFRPATGVPLIRMGRDNDGGYIIDGRNLEHTDFLAGMGINDDWSFEEEFLAQRDVPLFGYDASITAWEFFLSFWMKIWLFEPTNAVTAWKIFTGYRRFFDGKRRIHKSEFVSHDDKGRNVSLGTLMERDFGNAQNIFFKIDIEGCEYRILDELIMFAARIEGLAIEFHDIDLHMNRITDFVERFPLTLAHVHANNNASILEDGTPLVIELTFTRHAGDPTVAAVPLPHPLDMRCNCSGPEIALSFT